MKLKQDYSFQLCFMIHIEGSKSSFKRIIITKLFYLRLTITNLSVQVGKLGTLSLISVRDIFVLSNS